MVETTKTLTVDLTFVSKDDVTDLATAEDWEIILKRILDADDVKVKNFKKFELEK